MIKILNTTQRKLVVLASWRKSEREIDRNAYQRHAAVIANFRIKIATLRAVSRLGAFDGSADEAIEVIL